MKIYLVGGAVRDQLLGLPVTDRDWVVVAATAEMMIAQGYKPVSGGFPVFLHPDTGEEYALARREIKQGSGYRGFAVDTSVNVTLEEDLRRRDLCINAMAQTDDGELIDPYLGKQDLDARLLRHVSPAFIEDPLRVLRVARFAAHLGAADFKVAPDTLALMQQVAHSGELQTLHRNRIWKETQRAMPTACPWRYFEVLEDCGALAYVSPSLAETFSDTSMQVLHQAIADDLDRTSRWPVLMASLSLDITSATVMIEQQRIDKKTGDLLLQIISASQEYRLLGQLSSQKLLHFCERYTDRFNVSHSKVISACATLYPALANINRQLLLDVCAAAAQLNGSDLLAEGLTGTDLGNTLRARRIVAIENVVQASDDNG